MRNILFITLLIFAACQSVTDKKLEQALKLSGDNRSELDKVWPDGTGNYKKCRKLIYDLR